MLEMEWRDVETRTEATVKNTWSATGLSSLIRIDSMIAVQHIEYVSRASAKFHGAYRAVEEFFARRGRLTLTSEWYLLYVRVSLKVARCLTASKRLFDERDPDGHRSNE
jgi:hypothetical protein